jgi:hypothetical protein
MCTEGTTSRLDIFLTTFMCLYGMVKEESAWTIEHSANLICPNIYLSVIHEDLLHLSLVLWSLHQQ